MGYAFSAGSDQITGGESDVPEGWSDASWVVHDKKTKARSMSGRCYRMGNGPLHWTAKGQQAQAPSTASAEMRSIIEGIADGITLRELAYEYNIPQLEPMNIYTDNTAAVFISEDAASMKRTRADARGAVIVQDAVEEGTCQMKHWPGNNNIADIFTKWLPRNEFQRYRSMLLNLPAQRKLGLPVDDGV